MPRRPSKHAPGVPAMQWRWELRPQEVKPSLRRDSYIATPQATVFANDLDVDLHYVRATRPDDRITKDDVQAYIDDGKPTNAEATTRLPNGREVLYEMNRAMMHVSQQIPDALFLWTQMAVEQKGDEKLLVVYIEWAVKKRKPRVGLLHNRDKRFSKIGARATHPWGNHWGSRT